MRTRSLCWKKGEITEAGIHEELARTRGRYYELIKNQLELGSFPGINKPPAQNN